MRTYYFYSFLLILALSVSFSSCEETREPLNTSNSTADTWRISTDFIYDGGVGLEGIPTVDAPEFDSIPSIDYLEDEDLVLVLKVGDEIRAYPHPILDYHEVINDEIGEEALAITYCPLTGTGIAWDRIIKGQLTSFGGSGLIYNSNVMPYDRATGSHWSQMLLRSVKGEHNGTLLKSYTMLEMPWKTLKIRLPEAQVMTVNTGFSRSYSLYPYLDYRTNHDFLIFPVEYSDDRRNGKERLLGVEFLGEAKLYSFSAFSSSGLTIIHDSFKGNRLVLLGSTEERFMMAYQNRSESGDSFEFSRKEGDPEVVMTDDKGNEWNIFGEAVRGPNQGERLKSLNVFMGFWFAWATFYPFSEVFEG